jgi:hypothetical protein
MWRPVWCATMSLAARRRCSSPGHSNDDPPLSESRGRSATLAAAPSTSSGQMQCCRSIATARRPEAYRLRPKSGSSESAAVMATPPGAAIVCRKSGRTPRLQRSMMPSLSDDSPKRRTRRYPRGVRSSQARPRTAVASLLSPASADVRYDLFPWPSQRQIRDC